MVTDRTPVVIRDVPLSPSCVLFLGRLVMSFDPSGTVASLESLLTARVSACAVGDYHQQNRDDNERYCGGGHDTNQIRVHAGEFSEYAETKRNPRRVGRGFQIPR